MNYLNQDQLTVGEYYWTQSFYHEPDWQPWLDEWLPARYAGDGKWNFVQSEAIEWPVKAIGPIKNPDQFKDVNLEQLVDDFWVRSGGDLVVEGTVATINRHNLGVFVAAIAGQAIIDSGDPHLLQKMNNEIKMWRAEVDAYKEFLGVTSLNNIKLRKQITDVYRELIEARSKITELTLANYTPPKSTMVLPSALGTWFNRVFKL